MAPSAGYLRASSNSATRAGLDCTPGVKVTKRDYHEKRVASSLQCWDRQTQTQTNGPFV